MRVVPLEVFLDISRMVRIAIAAAAGAGVVPADIPADDTLTLALVPDMLDIAESAPVCAGNIFERDTSVAGNPIVYAHGTAAHGKVVSLRRVGDGEQDMPFVLACQTDDLGDSRGKFDEYVDKIYDTPADIGRDLFREVIEHGGVPARGIAGRDEDGVVSPEEPLFPHEFRELFERFEPLGDRRYGGFDVVPVAVQRKVEESPESVGDLMQTRQRRLIIFGAEENGIHFIGRELIRSHFVREERIARVYVSFPKPIEEPIRVKPYDICPKSHIDKHTFIIAQKHAKSMLLKEDFIE